MISGNVSKEMKNRVGESDECIKGLWRIQQRTYKSVIISFLL